MTQWFNAAGLRPFKRPPSKHRQQWVEDSTSSGTTAGIRPGGSSISTMGSMVSSNTLPVNLEQERRASGKKDWEEGLPSPVQEGGPSWEQVEELNGEVSDLRQRLMHEKEEANRLKLMVGPEPLKYRTFFMSTQEGTACQTL